MGSLDQIFPPAVIYLAESPSYTLGWPPARYAAEDDFELLFFTFILYTCILYMYKVHSDYYVLPKSPLTCIVPLSLQIPFKQHILTLWAFCLFCFETQ